LRHAGGVTSSSLEVLAGLALSTEEYVELMLFKDGRPSQFYQSYVKDIQAKIAENAAAEFSCIWREHQRLQGAKARTIISDELSSTLNNLQAELERSDLYDDVPSRLGVMRRAIPKSLVDKIGLETLMERLPEPYQRALFSSWVASHFVSSFCFFLPFDRPWGCYTTQCAHTSEFSLADLQVRCSGFQRRLPPFRSGSCEVNRLLYFFVKGKKGPLEAKNWIQRHIRS
jgi:Glutamate/Leucine/Phenylalanine/Valine dehydrogenase